MVNVKRKAVRGAHSHAVELLEVPEPTAALVTEGAAIDAEVQRLAPKVKRLEEIKGMLREMSCGKDASYNGVNGEVATVSALADTVVRTVSDGLLGDVLYFAKDKVYRLFRLSPVAEFEKVARAELKEKEASGLLKLLRMVGSGRVKFIR